MAHDDTTAAALDIGSNTVHMLAGRWNDGHIDIIDEASVLVGLGEDVYGGGAISPERLAHAVDAVATLIERARGHGAAAVVLAATAAVRDAANAGELADAVQRRTGIQMRAISGDREAELTFRGASMGQSQASLQVCDVGGGSTEVIRSDEGRIVFKTSLALGSSRLSRGFSSDPPTRAEVDGARDAAAAALTALPAWQAQRLVVTGGTATALAQVAGGSGRQHVLASDELDRLRDTLMEQPAAAIAAAHGIEEKRARLLPAGAAIIAALRDAARVPEVVLTAAGLRDGMLIEHFEK